MQLLAPVILLVVYLFKRRYGAGGEQLQMSPLYQKYHEHQIACIKSIKSIKSLKSITNTKSIMNIKSIKRIAPPRSELHQELPIVRLLRPPTQPDYVVTEAVVVLVVLESLLSPTSGFFLKREIKKEMSLSS